MAKATEATGKINKSAWIRAQSPSIAAKEVVAKAKAEGIHLSVAQVYTARSTAKKITTTGGNGSVKRRGRPATSKPSDKDVTDFRRLVLAIGFNRAEDLFAGMRREFGF